jgi:hypothetical protein
MSECAGLKPVEKPAALSMPNRLTLGINERYHSLPAASEIGRSGRRAAFAFVELLAARPARAQPVVGAK